MLTGGLLLTPLCPARPYAPGIMASRVLCSAAWGARSMAGREMFSCQLPHPEDLMQ